MFKGGSEEPTKWRPPALGQERSAAECQLGGFEDFKVVFGVPTAAGAVDGGFDVGVPSDFLEGEGGALPKSSLAVRSSLCAIG